MHLPAAARHACHAGAAEPVFVAPRGGPNRGDWGLPLNGPVRRSHGLKVVRVILQRKVVVAGFR